MLEAERLMSLAVEAADCSDFGPNSFRDGLDILISDINRDSERPAGSVDLDAAVLVKTLTDRLRVVDAIARRPAVLDQPVERPVFVFGIPRTGTTLLSNLLAMDPARRSPLKWELDDPVPPPTTDTLFSDPRAIEALAKEKEMLAAYPEAGKIYRMSATYPFECVSIFAHEFSTLMFESWGKLPNYRDFIFQSDWTQGYQYHKRFLQLHQVDAPGVWNLKMPSHILAIDQLLSVYPDARLIWTHRDPYTATGSFCSIIAAGHASFAGRVDEAWIAEDMPWQASEHAVRGLRAREDHPGRIIDVHYGDLMRDPLKTIRDLYTSLGDVLSTDAEQRMQAWLDENPQGRFGVHEYKLDKFGLTKAHLEPLFADYLAAIPIEPEGR